MGFRLNWPCSLPEDGLFTHVARQLGAGLTLRFLVRAESTITCQRRMSKRYRLLLDQGKKGFMLLPLYAPLSFASVYPVPTCNYKQTKQNCVLKINVQKGSAIKPILQMIAQSVFINKIPQNVNISAWWIWLFGCILADILLDHYWSLASHKLL